MNKTNFFLRNMVLSLVPVMGALFIASTSASAQNTQQAPALVGAHMQYAVYDGSTRAGWYSFPGQSPKLHIKGDEVRITSREESTVLLSRGADTAGLTAEVSLTRAPISTSSISGLAVLSDAQHAMVIGLEGGNVVLWQLDPDATRVVARQPVNGDSQFEFRVTGGNATEVRFFWRHRGDGAWHPLGDAATAKILTSWRQPLRFGLLLDGPQGSQVTFSNYRAGGSELASNSMAPSPITAAFGQ